MTPLERLKDDLSRRTDKYEHVVVACDDLAKLLAFADACVAGKSGAKRMASTAEMEGLCDQAEAALTALTTEIPHA